jgi:predicted metalloprotease with PDZ domain
MSSDLWFGEGVTSYFDDLIVYRAGLQSLEDLLGSYAGLINAVLLAPGRSMRSAEEMSQLAPFVDAAVSIDRTAWNNTFISYYTWGAMIGLAMDLSLLEKTAGKAGMDDYMKLMWTSYGVPGMKAAPGMVARTYSREDLQGRLAQLSGDGAFAQEFFARYVQGHDVPDFAPLFNRLGLIVRKRNAGVAWLGNTALTVANGGLRAGVVPFESPLYKAGVAQDDQIVSLGGLEVATAQDVQGVLQKHTPGTRLDLRFVRRSGELVTTGVVTEEDPRVEIVPAESTGAALSPEQRQARRAWLASRAK